MQRRLLLGMSAGSPSTDGALLICDLEILEPNPGSGIGLASKVTGARERHRRTGMIIAHDVGTSADKASLHGLDGRIVATATHAYPVDFGPGGRAEQNPEHWWRAVVATTAELLTRGGVGPGDIDAVGMSGQMMGAVFLGRNLAPVHPALIWADQRSAVQAEALAASIGPQEVYRRTGHRLNANYPLPKIMWVRDNEPEVWGRPHTCVWPRTYWCIG